MSTRRFPEPIVVPGRSRTPAVMRGFSQRRGLVSLVSCAASGRQPYLEGEAADAVFALTGSAHHEGRTRHDGNGADAAREKMPEGHRG